ncbi:phage tail tape measure protein [Pseudomonas sp. OA65]|uniref:phage tail tape measure protein n=1 Tax=Pseudomonas sp. OA65 TaxID=2818431 RepID=UPI001A9F0C76|nr:phage tail tape measure protein [Pseudomonas sp. OA65]MBO1539583.1 phage tail tape measure protein [Pseudomonas sp. OA65]
MANDLKLRVLLDAIDKASGPLKAIDKSSIATARALKETRDRLKALNAQQQDVSAWRAQRSAALRTEQALNAAREKVKTLSQQFAATGAPTRAMTQHFQKAVRAAQALKQQHQKQNEQLQTLRSRMSAAGISTQHLARDERHLRQQISATTTSLTFQHKQLTALTERRRRLNAARVSMDGSRRTAGELAAKGAVATAGGGSVLYAGARLLSPGIDFDASMSEVQAITRLEEQADALKALRAQARQLGGATQFTAGQAADAQGYLGMAGFEPHAIQTAMPGMLNLAAAGGTELAQTADIASNILSGLGLTAEEMDRLGDVLVGTFTRSNTTLQMLGDTMKYAAPMAKTYGVKLEVAAAMAGKLGDAGLQGSMGGTALSSIMNRLAAPPNGAEKALKQLNIITADTAGNLRPLPDLLKEIHDKTRALGTAEKGGLFKAIAGEEAVKGMAQLVEQAGTGQLQTLIASLRQSRGEAARTAKVMADNLKGDLITLSSAWQDLGIELQDQQNGPLRELVQSVIELVRSIKNWTRENPKLAAGLVKAIAIIAALAVGVGGLMLALASVLLPFAALRYFLVLLGFRLPGLIGLLTTLGRTVLPFLAKGLWMVGRALMLNPIGLTITAIAGAAYLLYQHWDAVTSYLLGAWDEIQSGFDDGLGGILRVLADFSPVGLIYQAFAAVMKYLGVDLPNRFTAFGGLMIDGLVKGLTSGMGKLKEVVDRLGTRTIDAFKETLGIHSPSRVFAELGGFTMDGLVQGLTRRADDPVRAMTVLSQRLIEAGERLVSVDSLTIDHRAPISPRPAQHIDSHDTYAIHIHAAPGMDADAVARAVRAELTRHQHEQAARRRSRLADLE